MDATHPYTNCTLCPRRCGVDRTAGETGYCGAPAGARISSAFPHMGEERPITGTNGSGTIFFRGCSLKCVFCQNHEISHITEPATSSPSNLTRTMLALTSQGCHNINFVTPTHVTPTIISAVALARAEGMTIPIVYNCGGYELPEVLEALAGTVDIYMPDLKFLDPARSERFLAAPDYPRIAAEAMRIMDAQVGLLTTSGPAAVRGLLIRHLVMPGGYDDSRAIIDFIADELTPGTAVNIMGQYRPCHRAHAHPDIATRPDPGEVGKLRAYARERGLGVV